MKTYKYKIYKPEISNRPTGISESVWYIEMNFEFTQQLSDDISLLDGISEASSSHRYLFTLVISTRFFNEEHVVEEVEKIINNFIKENSKPTKKLRKIKTLNKVKKTNRFDYITRGN